MIINRNVCSFILLLCTAFIGAFIGMFPAKASAAQIAESEIAGSLITPYTIQKSADLTGSDLDLTVSADERDALRARDDEEASSWVDENRIAEDPTGAAGYQPRISESPQEAASVPHTEIIKTVEGKSVHEIIIDDKTSERTDFENVSYEISAVVPDTGQSFVITDHLEDALEINRPESTSVTLDGETLPASEQSVILAQDDHSLTLTLEEDRISAYAGKRISVVFQATVFIERVVHEWEKYENTEDGSLSFVVPNYARFAIDGATGEDYGLAQVKIFYKGTSTPCAQSNLPKRKRPNSIRTRDEVDSEMTDPYDLYEGIDYDYGYDYNYDYGYDNSGANPPGNTNPKWPEPSRQSSSGGSVNTQTPKTVDGTSLLLAVLLFITAWIGTVFLLLHRRVRRFPSIRKN